MVEIQRGAAEKRQHKALADRANQNQHNGLWKQKVDGRTEYGQADARRPYNAQSSGVIAIARQAEELRGVGEQARVRCRGDKEGRVENGKRADEEYPGACGAERLLVHLA